ncbi:MAG: DUF4403 family protein [Polyangiaceae bacterium]|nr:DUF4403 family protein [Polyangiaceae bacterium]
MIRIRFAGAALLVLVATGCTSSLTPVYPSRPPASPAEPLADPTPSKVVVHTTITGKGLEAAIEEALPKSGEGTFPFVRGDRKYTYTRSPAKVSFGQGRIGIELHVDANLDMPVSSLDVGLDFKIVAEPVVTAEYEAKLQSVDVQVSSTDKVVKLADAAADVLEKLKSTVQAKLAAFSYDLKPLIAPAYERLARPLPIPMGDAEGCARLKLVGVEAGPTVLAGGIEKDIALVVAPSITFPCGPESEQPPLPPLANVSSLASGPFTVTIPVAASYNELAKSMGSIFTNGKYYFSKTYPELYLEKPEVYASKDQLVLKLHIAGKVQKSGIDADLDGDLYMTGHPTVVDNELRIPDLEPTIETSSFLLGLKAAFDGNTIRDQARAAMKLDIGARVAAAKDKLSTDLSFGEGRGCLKAQAHKVEVTGIHVHADYLRLYIAATAGASASIPCL